MFNKSKSSPKAEPQTPVQAIVQQSINFESTLVMHAAKRERIAWLIAMMSAILAFLLGCGYLLVMPLKEKEPYVIVVDKLTGTTSYVSRLREDTIPKIEALDKSNLAKYVISRESYEWNTVGRDWDRVLSMSVSDVSASYQRLFKKNDPSSRDVIYGQDKIVKVTILSVTPKDGNAGVVRFSQSTINRRQGNTESTRIYVADISYKYDPKIKLSEKQRIENPLGFFVTSYRTDLESTLPGTAPPAEWQGTGGSSVSQNPADYRTSAAGNDMVIQ